MRTIEHVWIEMPDGCRLSARLWLPDEAQQKPVSAILEYIPYRKRDGTRLRDEVIHGYFARRGYAAVRVDMRGSGESEGLLLDEYLPREQDDAVAVIAWIAAQSWCDGSVGMMGKSWGGFNALQVAARRPPALKAIVTVYSTDDRYADDIHFSGGCLLNDNLWWGAVMLAYGCRPPDPAVFGPGWREAWLQRLEALPFFSADWLEHQRRDGFWRQGSVCEDFSAVTCPVLALGGWADGYTDAVFRLLEGLDCPRAGLIGPWAHIYPHDGVPGPAIDFLAELVGWWDRWLKETRGQSVHQPMLKVWRQDAMLQPDQLRDAEGAWLSVTSWPPSDRATQTLPLSSAAEGPACILLASPQTVGGAGGEWCGFGVAGEAPGDQRVDDPGSFVVTTPPLPTDLELLGQPVATLRLAAETESGLICVRLGQVLPTGEIVRISYGLMNLTRRDGADLTTPLVPGEAITVRVPLHYLAHRVPAGARLHVAVSTSYWPMIWPSPEGGGVRLFPQRSWLDLPLQPSGSDVQAAAFPPPDRDELALAGPASLLQAGRFTRTRTVDAQTGRHSYEVAGDGGLFGEGVLRLDDTGTVLDHAMTRRFDIHPDDPLSARHEISQRYAMGRPGWSIAVETRTTMSSTAAEFLLQGEVVVTEGEAEVFRRGWRRTVMRDGV